MGQKKVDTPSEFRYHNKIVNKEYSADSLELSKLLNRRVINHESFFYSYSGINVDSTKSIVRIDTMLYNNDKNKIFILISIENHRNEYRIKVDNVYKTINDVTVFDGMGILVKRNNDATFEFRTYGNDLTNVNSLAECREILKLMYFRDLNLSSNPGFNKYKLDDKRMWNEPMWNKF